MLELLADRSFGELSASWEDIGHLIIWQVGKLLRVV